MVEIPFYGRKTRRLGMRVTLPKAVRSELTASARSKRGGPRPPTSPNAKRRYGGRFPRTRFIRRARAPHLRRPRLRYPKAKRRVCSAPSRRILERPSPQGFFAHLVYSELCLNEEILRRELPTCWPNSDWAYQREARNKGTHVTKPPIRHKPKTND